MTESRTEAIEIDTVSDLIDNDKIKSIVSIKKGSWEDDDEKLVIKEKILNDIKNSYDTTDFRWGRRDGLSKIIHIGWLSFDGLRYLGMKSADIIQTNYMIEYRIKQILFAFSMIGIFSSILVNLPDKYFMLALLSFIASIVMNGRLKGEADKKIKNMSEERLNYSIRTK